MMEQDFLETIKALTVFCTLVTALSAAVNVLTTWYQKARSPERVQNERIAKLEEYAMNDNRRIKALEESAINVENALKRLDTLTASLQENFAEQELRMDSVERGERVTQRALLAVMNHMASMDDGLDKSKLVEARDRLNDYLLEK
jgi:hypothetical protein